MLYTNIPGTDEKVSRICLGTMTFGEQNSESEAHEQLDYAIGTGINFLDTAELYAVPSRSENHGLTEQFIGSWFDKSGMRQKYFLATKVTGPSAGLSYVAPDLGFSRNRIHSAVENSLNRLRTDYIDLYQLHWPERKTNFFSKRGYVHNPDEAWEDNFHDILLTMKSLLDSGKIRYWGLSNETPWGVMHFLKLAEIHGLPKPVTIQNPYNLLNRTFEIGLSEIVHRENIGLIAYSPMAFGRLSGKFHRGIDTPSDRINKYKQMARYNGVESRNATSMYFDIAQKYGLSLAQMSLQFVTTRSFVTSTIIGATSIEQLKENIDSINVFLHSDCIKDINKIHESIPNPAP